MRQVFLELWVSLLWAAATLLQKAFGHHHNKREKIVHMQERTGKRRKSWLSNIPVIEEEMVELQAKTAGISGVVGFSVLGYNYLTESFRSPPHQKRENRTHV
jgi:hypothetical protein